MHAITITGIAPADQPRVRGRRHAAIRFGEAGPFPAEIDAVYRLDVNEFNGTESLQLVVEHWSPV